MLEPMVINLRYVALVAAVVVNLTMVYPVRVSSLPSPSSKEYSFIKVRIGLAFGGQLTDRNIQHISSGF